MPIKTWIPRKRSISFELVDIDVPLTCILYKLLCSTDNFVILSVRNSLKYSIGHNWSKFFRGFAKSTFEYCIPLGGSFILQHYICRLSLTKLDVAAALVLALDEE